MKKLELNKTAKLKSLITAFKNGVANTYKWRNNPDEITFCGKDYTYDMDNAYPFIFLTAKGENKIFYGKSGGIHKSIISEVSDYLLINRGYKMSDISGIHNDDNFRGTKYEKDGEWLDQFDVRIMIRGRYYIVDIPELYNKKCVIFSFWHQHELSENMMRDIIFQICKDKHFSDREVYLTNSIHPLIWINEFSPMNDDFEDNSEEEILHLMNSKDKQKATADFRNTRDKLLGKKLTMSNGQEMPLAQYNALRYVDECIINESVDKDLEEKVRKTVRDMIKDGDLPKSYDGEPLEMAEHYAHVLKKVFGDDYEMFHTQSMEDDNICCAVIDDEFKKNGGHYDMDDCENHLDSVKKWLDKIIKEEYSLMLNRKIYLTESQISYIRKELERARKETNTNPTEGQKEAGNYKMGRVKILGFDIAIENPKGSYRRGKNKSGKEWKTLMKNDYGYFTHTKAIDGDAVDVFLGTDFESNSIFAIDQKINGKFDETKVMLGFKNEEEARQAYLSNYEKGWNGLWRITEVSVDDFKEWLYDGYKQRKPFSEYIEIKKKKLNENVDFYKKDKLILGDDTDYVHVIDETFDTVVSEYESNNATPFLTKESIDEIVDDGELGDVLQSFDIQKQLNPKFWINGRLNSRVRLRLLEIADAFFDSMEVDWVNPKDIIMTGSLANYNWSKYSDIDLHIIINFKDVDDRVEFVKDYFDSKKSIWNNAHENLKIYGFPVELYVQDEHEEHQASGIYSIEKDKWIKEPERDDLSAVKLDKEYITHKTKNIVDKIDELSDACEGEKDVQKLDTLSNKVKNLFDNIKGMRKESLKSGSEMSNGNIMFKILRRLGYIGKLADLKRLTFDKINSIK